MPRGGWNKGIKHSLETRNRLSIAQRKRAKRGDFPKGENHSCWKGDKAGISHIHIYVRSKYPPPKCCQCCGSYGVKLDLANVSGFYDREISSYKYMCRKCHMISDGRLEKFINALKNKHWNPFKNYQFNEHKHRRNEYGRFSKV